MSQIFRRKPNRIKVENIYSDMNWFFITICVQNRTCIFEIDENVEENFNSPESQELNSVIKSVWLSLPNQYFNLTLDEYMIMPNHFHGIIGFTDTPISNQSQKPTDLSKIIKYFKSKTTIEIKDFVNNGELKFSSTKKFLENHNSIWQKSFYDHIILGDQDLARIQEYITNNPAQWELDILNPANYRLYIEKFGITK
jgi:putative transposase